MVYGRAYDGEWHHVSYELLALAEAISEKDYAWRPAPGVRSTSETIMHIVITNYWLLTFTSQPTPPGPPLKGTDEKTVTSKADVVVWLKRSLEAVRQAHLNETPGDLAKHVSIEGRTVTVDGIYLRIIVHANEHLGQLIAYARMNNAVPPWSGN
jgi:uncharacterized damage-inducible protein DinB